MNSKLRTSADSATMQINILSAGAIEPGLVAAVAAFREESGRDIKITWATAPTIRQRIEAGVVADIVIVPAASIDDFVRAGKTIKQDSVFLGRVGVGVVVRNDAPVPDISNTQALKQAVLDAESVVFNRASSGLYVEELLKKMGLLNQILVKTSRYDNGPALMKHLINGKGRELGFGAIIEILMFRDRGLKLVGPLPPEVQHHTTYMAAPMTASPNVAGAKAFIDYLTTPAAKALFAAHGID